MTPKEKFTPSCNCYCAHGAELVQCSLCKSAPMMYEALKEIDAWFESLKVSQDKNIKEKGFNAPFDSWDNSDIKSFSLDKVKEALKLAEGK